MPFLRQTLLPSSGLLAVLAVTGATTLTPPAVAGDTTANGFGGPAFTPLAGEANHVSVASAGGTVVFDDSSSTFSPGSCPRTNAFHTSTCALGDAAFVYVDLGDGTDTLDYNLSNVFVFAGGGAGDDLLSGGLGDDTIAGGPGNDTVDGSGGNDTLNDDFQSLTNQPGSGNDTQSGGKNDDLIMGGDSASTGAGAGADTISGDSGVDTYDATARTQPLTITVGTGSADDGEPGEHDTIATVEKILAGSGADTIVAGAAASTLAGGAGGDTLIGGAGADTLDGDTLAGAPGSGDDVLDGAGGADVMRGGDGTDTVSYASRSAGVTVSLDDVANDGVPGEGDNVRSDVERVVTGSGADTINARDGRAGSITCGAGTDTVVADTADVVAADCEAVDRPVVAGGGSNGGAGGTGTGGGGGTTPTTPTVPTPPAVLTLALTGTRTAKVSRRGAFTLPLTCSAGAAGCAGTLEVRAVARRKHDTKPAIRAALLARITYVIAPGARRSHTVTLPAALRRLVAKERTLAVTAKATAVIGTSALPLTTVTLRQG